MIQKEFIRNELRYRYPDLADSIRFPQQSVGRPLLFEGGVRKFGARIIVCSGEEMNTLTGSAQREPLFLCIGAPNADTINQYDVCVLPTSEQAGAVLNFVQRLFDRLDDWTQSLRQAAETGEGVEELLSRASAMLQNPVILLDERGHIIAQSYHAETSASISQSVCEALLAQEVESGAVKKLGNASAPDALFSRFQSADSRCTLLCMASDRPLYASDEIVLESLAGFLRLMLSERTLRLGMLRQHRGNEAAASAIRSLLLQDDGEQNAPELLRKLGWSETDAYAILVAEPINGDLRAAQADAICDRFESALEGCCAFALLPVVAAVVRTDLLENNALYEALKAIANENELHIGICEAFPGFQFLPQRLEQAKRSLNRAEKFGGAARYADVFEEELAGALLDFPKELLCMRSVLELSRYDRIHDTNYLETTEAYVKNHFNAVRTAGELFIHRSTFLYRLERIKAQFGLDLDDKDLSMLHLLFSLRIAREL